MHNVPVVRVARLGLVERGLVASGDNGLLLKTGNICRARSAQEASSRFAERMSHPSPLTHKAQHTPHLCRWPNVHWRANTCLTSHSAVQQLFVVVRNISRGPQPALQPPRSLCQLDRNTITMLGIILLHLWNCLHTTICAPFPFAACLSPSMHTSRHRARQSACHTSLPSACPPLGTAFAPPFLFPSCLGHPRLPNLCCPSPLLSSFLSAPRPPLSKQLAWHLARQVA